GAIARCGGEERAGDGERADVALVAEEDVGAPGPKIPNARAVVAAAGDERAVGGPGEREHRVVMADEPLRAPRLDVGDLNRALGVAGGEAVPPERRGGDAGGGGLHRDRRSGRGPPD